MTAIYRVATAADAGAIMDLLRDMHAENGIASLDEQKVRARIDELLRSGWIILAEVDGALAGSIALQFQSFWYSSDIHIRDNWFFVRKGYRRSSIALRLKRTGEDMARRQNVPFAIGLFGKQDINRKRAFFRDMRECGHFYMTET